MLTGPAFQFQIAAAWKLIWQSDLGWDLPHQLSAKCLISPGGWINELSAFFFPQKFQRWYFELDTGIAHFEIFENYALEREGGGKSILNYELISRADEIKKDGINLKETNLLLLVFIEDPGK